LIIGLKTPLKLELPIAMEAKDIVVPPEISSPRLCKIALLEALVTYG